jgi:hypothetical protein
MHNVVYECSNVRVDPANRAFLRDLAGDHRSRSPSADLAFPSKMLEANGKFDRGPM